LVPTAPFAASQSFPATAPLTRSGAFARSQSFIASPAPDPIIGAGGGSNSNADGGNGVNPGAIAGGIVGVLAVLAAVTLLFLLKRRKKEVLEEDEFHEDGDTGMGDSASIGSDDQFVSEYGFSDRHESADEQALVDDLDDDVDDMYEGDEGDECLDDPAEDEVSAMNADPGE
jgi:hypothetical protein